jgi:hypothetical protein
MRNGSPRLGGTTQCQLASLAAQHGPFPKRTYLVISLLGDAAGSDDGEIAKVSHAIQAESWLSRPVPN